LYKTVFYISLLFVINQLGFAQNLIYNGDFEIYSKCPDNTSIPTLMQIEYCTGWTAPRRLGTADYFNTCSLPTPQLNFPIAGVPVNLFGTQEALSGSGYVGLYGWFSFGYDLFEYREYVQTKLPNPLQKGKAYKFSFNASLANSSYTIEKLGAVFSAESFVEYTEDRIDAMPQIVNSNGYLMDSLGWMLIEGIFLADGTEEYLTIGYFEDSTTMKDTIPILDPNEYFHFCYFYIDDAVLEEVSIDMPNVFTPNTDNVNDNFEFGFFISELIILDRWGNKINHIIEPNAKWSGLLSNGEQAPEGTYFYKAIAGINNVTGFVQLIR
jgi:gliding motility-associated-like protein